MPYYLRLADNKDLTLTPHVYTKALARARGALPPSDQPWRLPGRRLRHLRQDRQCRRGQRRSPTRAAGAGCARYLEANGRFQFSPEWSLTSSIRAGHRQDRHAPLRPHPRRPPAQLRRGRADHARQLSVDRRLGVRGLARRRRPEAVPDRAARDRRAAAARRSVARRHRSSSRATASPSCASTARTRSAPSPARAGTCAA